MHTRLEFAKIPRPMLPNCSGDGNSGKETPPTVERKCNSNKKARAKLFNVPAAVKRYFVTDLLG